MKNELKTLKDIFDKKCGFITIEESINGMNVVKNSPLIIAYDKMLKANAVKWVKTFGEEINLIKFKHFFNLTEEDLK